MAMRRMLVLTILLVIAFSPVGSIPAESEPVPAIVVASSILSIASSLNSLFGGKPDDTRFQHEVIGWLLKFDQQLSTIQNQLDAINARFDELQVHIDRKFEQQRVVDVIAVVRSIDQHYPAWVKPGYTPNPSSTIPAPSTILDELRRKVTAVRVYPSYANFSTVALGMAYEHLLLVNVFHQPDDNSDSQLGFAQYAQFFKEAASVEPEKGGTVGQAWVSAETALKQIDVTFAAVPKPLYCAQGPFLCVPSNPNEWNWYYKVYQATLYSGDPLNGFQATNVSDNPERNCAGVYVDGPGGNPEGICKANSPPFRRQRYCTQLVSKQLVDPNGGCSLPQWHQNALDRKQALDDLHAALQSLKGYYTQAARWAGTPRAKIVFLSPDMPPPESAAATARRSHGKAGQTQAVRN
jgi:hypothetical protein